MLRPATAKDYDAIESLSKQIWGDDLKAKANRPEGWNRRLWTVQNYMTAERKPKETSLLAEIEGQVVAAAVITESEPRNHIYIQVAPTFRDRGFGRALFEALDSKHKGAPYMTREFGDAEAVKMFEALGFSTVERVTEGRIDPTHPATASWIDKQLATESKLCIRSINQQSWISEREVARFFDSAFQKALAWVPVAPHTETKAIDFFLGKAIPTLCAFANQQLIGALTMGGPGASPFDDPGAYLGWLTVAAPKGIAEADITNALVARALDTARKRGLDVHIEAADIFPQLHACVWRIPGADIEEGLTILISD